MTIGKKFSINRSLSVLFCLGCLLKVLCSAWVTEDAYITFRVIDNFVHGYGLRWNVDERVQVYTHPLWMLLHIPFYALYDNPYRLTLMLSLICGLAAVAVIMRLAPGTGLRKELLVIMPLVLSYSFNGFVICGLEYPLTFLLLALAATEWLRQEVRVHRLLALACLCLLTRFDNVVILAPMLLLAAWQWRRQWRLSHTLLAISPLLLWCLFSLWYYGFVFPNTKYAKLNTGIALSDYLAQGMHYLGLFIPFDLPGTLLIVLALAMGARGLTRAVRQRNGQGQDAKIATMAAGCLLQLVYVAYVGGDFMVGRFLVSCVVLSVIVLYTAWSRADIAEMAVCAALAVAAIVNTYVLSPAMGDMTDAQAHYGIVNERQYYFRGMGATTDPDHMVRQQPQGLVVQVFAGSGAQEDIYIDGQRNDNYNGDTLVTYSIGVVGYFLGPRVTIIDKEALTDPLLARLPIDLHQSWRIGHFVRELPAGYYAARKSGGTAGMDPDLALYYQKLRLVTAGSLWDWERFKAIIGFQLGDYDAWRQAYVQKQQ